MQIIISIVVLVLFLSGCSTKNPPLTDLSNAKMALVKVDTAQTKKAAPQALSALQAKYKILQGLMKDKEYDKARFLAQEIQADARLLEKKSERIMLEERVRKMQGEINLINKDFTQIKE